MEANWTKTPQHKLLFLLFVRTKIKRELDTQWLATLPWDHLLDRSLLRLMKVQVPALAQAIATDQEAASTRNFNQVFLQWTETKDCLMYLEEYFLREAERGEPTLQSGLSTAVVAVGGTLWLCRAAIFSISVNPTTANSSGFKINDGVIEWTMFDKDWKLDVKEFESHAFTGLPDPIKKALNEIVAKALNNQL